MEREALAGEKKFGIDDTMTDNVAKQIKAVCDLDLEMAIVVGGGNFWRGRSSESMDRATADYMGMLATVMNTLALQYRSSLCPYSGSIRVRCRLWGIITARKTGRG